MKNRRQNIDECELSKIFAIRTRNKERKRERELRKEEANMETVHIVEKKKRTGRHCTLLHRRIKSGNFQR